MQGIAGDSRSLAAGCVYSGRKNIDWARLHDSAYGACQWEAQNRLEAGKAVAPVNKDAKAAKAKLAVDKAN